MFRPAIAEPALAVRPGCGVRPLWAIVLELWRTSAETPRHSHYTGPVTGSERPASEPPIIECNDVRQPPVVTKTTRIGPPPTRNSKRRTSLVARWQSLAGTRRDA